MSSQGHGIAMLRNDADIDEQSFLKTDDIGDSTGDHSVFDEKAGESLRYVPEIGIVGGDSTQ